MMKKQNFLKLFLFLGLGSLLTLFSSVYNQTKEPMFLDVVPIAYKSSQLGFPLPIYHSYAAWWEDGFFDYSVGFIWEAALLDILFYSVILWFGYQLIKMVTKARTKR